MISITNGYKTGYLYKGNNCSSIDIGTKLLHSIFRLKQVLISPFIRILHYNPTRNLYKDKSFSKRSRCQAAFHFICVVCYYLKSAQFFGKDTTRFWRGSFLSFGFKSCISKHVFQNFEQTKVQTNVIKNRSM